MAIHQRRPDQASAWTARDHQANRVCRRNDRTSRGETQSITCGPTWGPQAFHPKRWAPPKPNVSLKFPPRAGRPKSTRLDSGPGGGKFRNAANSKHIPRFLDTINAITHIYCHKKSAFPANNDISGHQKFHPTPTVPTFAPKFSPRPGQTKSTGLDLGQCGGNFGMTRTICIYQHFSTQEMPLVTFIVARNLQTSSKKTLSIFPDFRQGHTGGKHGMTQTQGIF